MTRPRTKRCLGACGLGIDKPHPQASGYCLPCGERYLEETLAVIVEGTGELRRIPKDAIRWGSRVAANDLRAGLLRAYPLEGDRAYWLKPSAKFGIQVTVLPQFPVLSAPSEEVSRA